MNLKAIRSLARLLHRGQEYGDNDYFAGHLEPVAALVEENPASTDKHVAAAYLHDVIEDTTATSYDLLELGVDPEVVDIVVRLTRTDGIGYEDYITRVGECPDATLVKMADLQFNSGCWPGHRPRYCAAIRYLEGDTD